MSRNKRIHPFCFLFQETEGRNAHSLLFILLVPEFVISSAGYGTDRCECHLSHVPVLESLKDHKLLESILCDLIISYSLQRNKVLHLFVHSLTQQMCFVVFSLPVYLFSIKVLWVWKQVRKLTRTGSLETWPCQILFSKEGIMCQKDRNKVIDIYLSISISSLHNKCWGINCEGSIQNNNCLHGTDIFLGELERK